MLKNEIDLNGKGYFNTEAGGFTVTEPNLERPWSYLYTNESLLLKLNNYGPHSAQIAPPGGMLLFKTPSNENSLPIQIFVNCKNQNLTSFLSPLNRNELKSYRCQFLPTHAQYVLEYNQLSINTKVGIDDKLPLIWFNSEILNTTNESITFEILPVWRIFHASGALAPWDAPELYQTCGFFNQPSTGIFVENRNPHGIESSKTMSSMITNLDVSEAEIDYRKFAQSGNMLYPDKLNKPLSIPNNQEFRIGHIDDKFLNIGTQNIAAMKSKTITLKPNEKFNFSIVIEHHEKPQDYTQKIQHSSEFLNANRQNKALKEIEKTYNFWTKKLQLNLPDQALSEYLQNYLPWQLYWVGKLDRGWPTGMRGTRDSAQDYSGIALIEPSLSRQLLLDSFSCQKIDGGFFRQFSTSGTSGKHDMRDYVDSGCWVFELLYDYIRNSGDIEFLNAKCRTFDSEKLTTIKEHAEKLLNYYLQSSNRGEHGLILIHEGDWNDSLNTVGLELRGESVMVSCQVIFLLKIAAELFPEKQELYLNEAEKLRKSLRIHALNSEGFLNGAFNDNGVWLFSDSDPDGQKRINSPVNSWGVIAGVFETNELNQLFSQISTLKGPCGYRLYYPPMGNPIIEKAGRIGTGGLVAGLGENGTVYNHGSQGFLLRAAAVAKRADLLEDILKYALPFDQTRHPVEVSKSEPYGIVNYYLETPRNFGEGGAPFLSGTISTIFRAVFENILGINLAIKDFSISPCLPANYLPCTLKTTIRDCDVMLKITNLTGDLYLNGELLLTKSKIPYEKLKANTNNIIELK